MSTLRRFLDRMQPLFSKGGRLEKYGALYEMFDTLIYSPADVTRSAPHVRDGIDLKRVMIYVVFASMPAVLVGIYNIGYQANFAMETLGVATADGWRPWLLIKLGIGFNPESISACFWHGFLYFLPIYIVTLVVGGFWEILFAVVRNHEVNEGFLVTSWLFVATLPATIPLWQVALGISFGIVIGKEVFGGTGKNFLNPALVGRAFLFFAYPAEISGEAIWVAVDGYSGATPLALAAGGGVQALAEAGISWSDAFIGTIQGSLGEVSALACLLGAVFLVYTGIASYRIMLGVVIGLSVTVYLLSLLNGDVGAVYQTPWYWHLVLGGVAFGLVFMATDPVSASMTNTGKWIYGVLIGFVTALIRVVNPAYTEGVMIAILFGNVFAPLIDYFVIQANIRRRRRRFAQSD
ncbi:MAG: NADH:ubiquinone reductase (Na(+)-transporting) subunit B [Gammaproteobacteria bacterium]|jgi:Na+-transporting NADH:ubiquinone oxidoreductase subunit B|nr:NADH:ubiquinone reductase (Na(+)-transporting) subunit B [Gammaproteobacteria bacterium]